MKLKLKKIKWWHWAIIAFVLMVIFNFQTYKDMFEARMAPYQDQSRGFVVTGMIVLLVLVVMVTGSFALIANKYLIYIIIGVIAIGMLKAITSGMGGPRNPWD